ncbi:hypothetical protein B296_00051744 [Ensete ventricosum]|uniref:Uncharacterized protein n=1 Tax=Ensete ventricosum TaxID=4639 RepID=A0A426YFD3_ENSVE|nr:hypothetical protein B296_00051744 [Ensete ventricosum]
MGENPTPKRPTSTYIPQHICSLDFSPAAHLYNSSSFGAFLNQQCQMSTINLSLYFSNKDTAESRITST